MGLFTTFDYIIYTGSSAQAVLVKNEREATSQRNIALMPNRDLCLCQRENNSLAFFYLQKLQRPL